MGPLNVHMMPSRETRKPLRQLRTAFFSRKKSQIKKKILDEKIKKLSERLFGEESFDQITKTNKKKCQRKRIQNMFEIIEA